jgi:hypothetical protein
MAHPAWMVRPESTASPERRASRETLGLQVRPVRPVLMALQVPRVPRETKALQVSPERPELRVRADLRVPLDLKDPREFKVPKAFRVPRGPWAFRVRRVRMDSWQARSARMARSSDGT